MASPRIRRFFKLGGTKHYNKTRILTGKLEPIDSIFRLTFPAEDLESLLNSGEIGLNLMKKTRMGSAGIAFVLAITSILHAQATTAFVPSVSAANLNPMLQAVETTTPQAAESVPSVGTFWSAQNPNWPPLPSNFNNLDAWNLGNGVYMLDDFDFDYQAQAQSRAMADRCAVAGR